MWIVQTSTASSFTWNRNTSQEVTLSYRRVTLSYSGFGLSTLAPKTLHHNISIVWFFSLNFRVLLWSHHKKYLVFSLPWELEISVSYNVFNSSNKRIYHNTHSLFTVSICTFFALNELRSFHGVNNTY